MVQEVKFLSHRGTHGNVLQEKQSKHQCVPLQVNHLIKVLLCDDTDLRQNVLCLLCLLNNCETPAKTSQSVKGKTFLEIGP